MSFVVNKHTSRQTERNADTHDDSSPLTALWKLRSN